MPISKKQWSEDYIDDPIRPPTNSKENKTKGLIVLVILYLLLSVLCLQIYSRYVEQHSLTTMDFLSSKPLVIDADTYGYIGGEMQPEESIPVHLEVGVYTVCSFSPGGWGSGVKSIDYDCDEGRPDWNKFTDEQKKITLDSVKREIKEQSKEYGINPAEAFDIAYCESHYNPFATSANSSAKGVYQFLDNTWEKYCIGDQFDFTDNIKCFMEMYPHNKSWWECKI